MKKSNIMIIIILAFWILLSSCATYNEDSGFEKINSSESTDGSENNLNDLEEQLILQQKNKENRVLDKKSIQPKESMIKTTYPEQSFFKDIIFWEYNPVVSFQHYLYSVEEDFPVECFRMLDDNNAYSIYQTDKNGWIYCFYSKIYDTWILSHSTYLKKAMVKSSFSSLSLGDDVENVGKIDPAFNAINNYLLQQNQNIDKYIHLLKDGLLVIEYNENTNAVKTITFFDDFKYETNGVKYDYSILPQDYPQ